MSRAKCKTHWTRLAIKLSWGEAEAEYLKRQTMWPGQQSMSYYAVLEIMEPENRLFMDYTLEN